MRDLCALLLAAWIAAFPINPWHCTRRATRGGGLMYG